MSALRDIKKLAKRLGLRITSEPHVGKVMQTSCHCGGYEHGPHCPLYPDWRKGA